MAFDFPNSPTLGQGLQGPGGIYYIWDGTKWLAQAQAASPPTVPQAAYDSVGRNLVHNGLFSVQQRGAGSWTPAGNVFTADRWLFGAFTDTSTAAIQTAADGGRAAIGDEAFNYYYQVVINGNAAAGAYTQLYQSIENIRRISGKTLTVSFWASCGTGTLRLGLNFWTTYGTGGTPSAGQAALATGQQFTISTTWTRYSATVTIPSSAGKTFGTNNDGSVQLTFGFSSGTTNNAFFGNVGVQSGQIYLWGVQLEIGSVATPLEKRDPMLELALCQRFYLANANIWFGAYLSGAGQNMGGPVFFPVTMRAVPTISFPGASLSNVGSPASYVTSPVGTVVVASSSAAGYCSLQSGIIATADL